MELGQTIARRRGTKLAGGFSEKVYVKKGLQVSNMLAILQRRREREANGVRERKKRATESDDGLH